MRLAEAIRKGAGFRPQAWGTYFRRVDGRVEGSCALGAAYEAATGQTSFDESNETVATVIKRLFGVDDYTIGIVAAYNDHGLTREQIADFLDRRDGIPTPTELLGGVVAEPGGSDRR